MLSDLDNFYLKREEPTRSCLLAIKEVILKHNPLITHEWKYKLPFFCYKGKMLCYIWFHKKYKKPYLGFYNGALIKNENLLAEDRSRVKIFLFDVDEDLPIEKINDILTQAIYIHDNKLNLKIKN
jgi:hypothetical protein